MDSVSNLPSKRDAVPNKATIAPTAAATSAAIGYAGIEPELGEVELRLRQELQSRYERLTPILQHGVLLGGKRMRPALVLLAGKACGRLTPAHVTIGTVLELVHTATLVHDDVLDDASNRRHLPTINAKWDPQTSILLGDYLFAQSFALAATLGDTLACRLIGLAAQRVCEGELRQVHSRNEVDLDESTYTEIVRGKTAELCSVACRLGADYAGADPTVSESLADFGDALGIAFQIADDYLDLWGQSERTGKTLGTDLLQGKMTLPLIRLLDTANARDRAAILTILRGAPEQRLGSLRPLLDASDAKVYTQGRAQYWVDKATGHLESLPNSTSKRTLQKLADFAISRQF